MNSKETVIDRSSKIPVFKQIYSILLGEMKDGLYAGTGKLPSENELCLRFDVERNTVRKALQILVDENLITRVPGIGSKLLEGFPGGAGQPKIISRSAGHTKQKNNIILLISQVDYLHSPDMESFHYKLINNFEKRLSKLGYNLLFKPMGQGGIVTDTIHSTLPRGVIFNSFNPDSYYKEAASFGLPCVSVNHYTPLFASIVSNNFEGAYKVAKELVDAGHRRIAFITGKSSHQTSIERLNGVQALYSSLDLPLKSEYIIPGNWTFRSGVEAAEKILDMKVSRRPSAVFAFNDDIAYGCYSVFQNHGLSVPKDISIAGFDKSDRYVAMFPPITTVDVNMEAIVDYACWYLSSSLSGWAPTAQAKIQIDTTICDNGTIKNLDS